MKARSSSTSSLLQLPQDHNTVTPQPEILPLMSQPEQEMVLETLWNQMEKLATSGDKENGVKSRRIALQLISYSGLPLLYRIRAPMTLACGDNNYLWHAQEAVRLAEKGIKVFGSDTKKDAGISENQAKEEKEAEQALLECARETLREAEKDYAELRSITEVFNDSNATKWAVTSRGDGVVNGSSKSVPAGSAQHASDCEEPVSASLEDNSINSDSIDYDFVDSAPTANVSRPQRYIASPGNDTKETESDQSTPIDLGTV
ncbi:hypothetical protein D6D15_04844 [Aureobasidium pullulans]|uniref:Uncharacterized protein n=2 Tax=Aureobasidium pullulans TaxID=5580 RepID=A0A4S9BC38_AURPU|nr:hypothetical protein D6D15_04844 [Aureobasidium pullulans]